MATVGTAPEATREVQPDGRLVEAQLAGDSHAFEILYRRYWNRLVHFCREQTGDRQLAQDLAQDTMVRFLEKADSFDTDRPVWPWLRAIARNLTIDHLRRPKEYLDLDTGHRTIRDDAIETVIRVDRVEEQSHLAPMLAHIPERQCVALRLRYALEWTRREVANYFDITLNACDQLVYRARQSALEYYERVKDSGDTRSRCPPPSSASRPPSSSSRKTGSQGG